MARQRLDAPDRERLIAAATRADGRCAHSDRLERLGLIKRTGADITPTRAVAIYSLTEKGRDRSDALWSARQEKRIARELGEERATVHVARPYLVADLLRDLERSSPRAMIVDSEPDDGARVDEHW